MRIGIDIDNTISNTNELLIEEIFKYDLEYLGNRGFKDRDAYKFTEMFNISEEEYKDFRERYFNKIIPNIPAKPHASEVIKRLMDDGNEVILITHRNTIEFKNPYKMTKKWLKKNKIGYDKLIVDSGDKGIVAKNECIDLFIDDLPKNLDDISNNGIEVLMFDAYYNRKNNKYKRVISWEEIYNIIRKKK